MLRRPATCTRAILPLHGRRCTCHTMQQKPHTPCKTDTSKQPPDIPHQCNLSVDKTLKSQALRPLKQSSQQKSCTHNTGSAARQRSGYRVGCLAEESFGTHTGRVADISAAQKHVKTPALLTHQHPLPTCTADTSPASCTKFKLRQSHEK